MNHNSQTAQFKRTNIKVVKTTNVNAIVPNQSTHASAPPQGPLDGGITPSRVRNVTIYNPNSQVESSSLGPPPERHSMKK